MSKSDPKIRSLFLSCDGFLNSAVVQKKLLGEGGGIDLLIDDQLIKSLDASEAKEQTLLMYINQICDAGFELKPTYWAFDASQAGLASMGIDFQESWSLYNGHTLHIYQKAGIDNSVDLVYRDPVVGEFIPVNGNDHYQLTGHFGLHRCTAIYIVEFHDAQRKLLTRHESVIQEGKLGGKLLDDYLAVNEPIQIPKKAVFARLLVRKLTAKSLEIDSFLFFTRPAFTLISAQETAPLKWEKSPIDVDGWQTLRKYDHKQFAYIEFPLPEKAYDGQAHAIALIDRDTGLPAQGSPKTFVYETNVHGKLEKLDGSRVVGWISQADMPVDLYVDGQFVAGTTSANANQDSEQFSFIIALPVSVLDGRPHLLEVKVPPSGKLIGVLAEITPYHLTPWNVLQKYSGKPLPARLSPAAAYRYDSLRASLLALSEAAQHKKGAELAELIGRITVLGRLHEQLLAGFEKIRHFEHLAFPSVAHPDVSIVVPVHNKFPVTYYCLAALLFAYNKASFEVILVDDGSSDETLDILELVDGIQYLRNETSQGFIRSCNRGASLAKGKYIVMLNNDTEPTVHWLDELIFAFEQFDQVGLAGAKLLYPDGKLQEAGGIVWSSGNPWNYGRGGNPYEPRFSYTRQADYLSGAAIMLSTSLWNEIGGFSEEYCPAYFEDTDLAFKVRAAGYKTLFVPLSVVYHFEGVSSGTSVTSGTKRYQEINRPKFKQKWIHDCRFNGEEGKHVDLNKDRGVSYRALVIDYQTPRPDIDAGSYAAIQEMRLLQSLGFKVTFVPENLAYMGQYTETLQRLGIEIVYSPFEYSMQSFLEKRGGEFDIVYITRYYVAKNHLPWIRQYAPQAKVLFCNADLHFLREVREAIEQNDQDLMNRACLIREEELGIMLQVDVVLSYNPIEHAVVLSHNLNGSKITTCPWVVDLTDDVPGFAGRKDIAFLGGFGHPPNKAAVLFFINHVMPILRYQLPDAKFRIYGSNFPAELEKLACEDVVIEGYIENVADIYDTCRVFVAPLLTGAGIKGKVIDALAHGTPSVLTPIAAEGTPLRHELEVMIAETAQEWADAVTVLYTDQTVWENMSKAARHFAGQHYSFANGRKLMLKALEACDVFASTHNQALVVKRSRTSV
ncbi:MAG: glycosyltransferase [Methylovulum sp.]|uniref:glycosyltransferase n=1 Tax=Methylovulum sp. TaxID=1916980 RepID=UPI002604C0A2|nr:glycosyltransferase [Methylovulum sp.]MDD2725285.1 glycosyltransferase [Methylovulum sp.]